MDKIYLMENDIDYDEGVERVLGDSGLYEKMLALFEHDESFGNAKSAYSEGNREALLLNVHAIKGVSANLELKKLYEISSKMVNMLRSGAYTEEQLAEDYKRFENIYSATVAIINKAKGI